MNKIYNYKTIEQTTMKTYIKYLLTNDVIHIIDGQSKHDVLNCYILNFAYSFILYSYFFHTLSLAVSTGMTHIVDN